MRRTTVSPSIGTGSRQPERSLLATVFDEATGDVVAEPLPALLWVWLGVSRSPVSSKSLPASSKSCCAVFRYCASVAWRSPVCSCGLNRGPDVRIDDRWMLALVDTSGLGSSM